MNFADMAHHHANVELELAEGWFVSYAEDEFHVDRNFSP